MDPDLFFPGPDEDQEQALEVCRTCPVREECLEWALIARERYGIWGGTTEQERRRLVRRSA
jgi:WhiB family redox-sensing transcriptional regulator